ncbi:hypothetical protein Sango_2474600 [Sesamum angolense]|uniref:Integrase zinc-binding domain-containing protein n=1 Tax=Sesamum angolense TaxID=2727404 RepID=A0AAE1W3A0_9LAMI|nr:hypothetical protein Sango_2474600 [Sesamum angolense]
MENGDAKIPQRRDYWLRGTERAKSERWAARFIVLSLELYKKTYQSSFLKCLDKEDAEYVMRQIHEGSCGNHLRGRSLATKDVQRGYFWPTLMEDTKKLVGKCEQCQKYSNQIHSPTSNLEVIKAAHLSDRWGIDIVGAFHKARTRRNS